MEQTGQLHTMLNFRDAGEGYPLVGVSVDWNGDPVLLFEEGRPPLSAGPDAMRLWYETVPHTHRIVHRHQDAWRTVRIPNTTNSRITWIAQPLDTGWLLVDARGGDARIVDAEGQLLREIQLGDAIQHVQTTRKGNIWVGYFDEGVFGDGIGRNGLVCFDSYGKSVFLFQELAQSVALPSLDDCYSLNVSSDNQIWVCYFSGFPLVCLKNFQPVLLCDTGHAVTAFAIRGDHMLGFSAHQPHYLFSLNLVDDSSGRVLLFDEMLNPVDISTGFRATGRMSKLYLYDDRTLYELL